MILFGCVNTPPDALSLYLHKQLGVDVSFIDPLTNVPSTPRYVPIFLGVKSLEHNLKTVNSRLYKDVIGVVCDAPIVLEVLEGINKLDYYHSDNIHIDSFKFKPIDKSEFKRKRDKTIKIVESNYLNSILDKIQSFQGILTPFMTFIYVLPSSTHQKPVKELACSWLASDKDMDQLIKSFDKLTNSLSMSQSKKDRFFTLLSSDIALNYKKVLKIVKSMDLYGEEFEKVIAANNVSAYEIRYILAINKKVGEQ